MCKYEILCLQGIFYFAQKSSRMQKHPAFFIVLYQLMCFIQLSSISCFLPRVISARSVSSSDTPS